MASRSSLVSGTNGDVRISDLMTWQGFGMNASALLAVRAHSACAMMHSSMSCMLRPDCAAMVLIRWCVSIVASIGFFIGWLVGKFSGF